MIDLIVSRDKLITLDVPCPINRGVYQDPFLAATYAERYQVGGRTLLDVSHSPYNRHSPPPMLVIEYMVC